MFNAVVPASELVKCQVDEAIAPTTQVAPTSTGTATVQERGFNIKFNFINNNRMFSSILCYLLKPIFSVCYPLVARRTYQLRRLWE